MPIVSAESMVPNAPEDPFALINKMQVMRSNQALAEERQRKVQTEAEIQAIAQRHGDDHDATVAEISRKYPALGYKIGQDLEQQRYNKAQALLENSKLERAKIQNGLSLIQGVAPDGSNWEPVRDGVIKDNPKLTPFLAGKPYSPELVQTIAKAGQTQDAYLDQIQKASEGYLNKEKQLAYAHLVVANDINPAKQQATQQMIKGAGLSLFGQAIPDVASAQTIIDQYAKAASEEKPQAPETEAIKQWTAEHGRVPTYAERLQIRKQFGQADDRPRISVNVGDKPLTPYQKLNETRQLRNDFNRETAAARTAENALAMMRSSLEAVKNGAAPAGSQGVLVTFQKILDPTSVVRESEYARSSSGLSLMGRLEGSWMKISQGGAGVTTADLEQFVKLSEQFAVNQRKFAQQSKDQIDEIAKGAGLNPKLITRDVGAVNEAVEEQTPKVPAGTLKIGKYLVTPK